MAMTVGELRAALAKMEPDALVLTEYPPGGVVSTVIAVEKCFYYPKGTYNDLIAPRDEQAPPGGVLAVILRSSY